MLLPQPPTLGTATGKALAKRARHRGCWQIGKLLQAAEGLSCTNMQRHTQTNNIPRPPLTGGGAMVLPVARDQPCTACGSHGLFAIDLNFASLTRLPLSESLRLVLARAVACRARAY